MNAPIRKFDTGATRDADHDKLDFDGFESPLVMERYAKYMHEHRKLANGTLRDSDNWQKGIPFTVYMKSLWRHFFDVWKAHRGLATPDDVETNLCAVLFNAKGYLHELIKARHSAQSIDTSTKPVDQTAKSVYDQKLAEDVLFDTQCGHEQPLADPYAEIAENYHFGPLRPVKTYPPITAESAYLASFYPNNHWTESFNDSLTELMRAGIGDVPHTRHSAANVLDDGHSVAKKAPCVADPGHPLHHVTLHGPESRL